MQYTCSEGQYFPLKCMMYEFKYKVAKKYIYIYLCIYILMYLKSYVPPLWIIHMHTYKQLDIHRQCYQVRVCVSIEGVAVGGYGLCSATPVCQILSQPIVLKFSHNGTVSSPKQSPYHGPEMTRLCGRPQHRHLRAGCTELEVSERSNLVLLFHA